MKFRKLALGVIVVGAVAGAWQAYAGEAAKPAMPVMTRLTTIAAQEHKVLFDTPADAAAPTAK